MKLFRRSLRNRFFFSLITLVLVAAGLIAVVTIYKFSDESKHYQQDKLNRKVASIKASINYQIENTTYPVNSKHIPLIFKDKIYEISHIQDTRMVLYDLEGNLLKSSRATFVRSTEENKLSDAVISRLKKTAGNHYSYQHTDETGQRIMSSYSYITDTHFKPLAILSLPRIESDGFLEKELKDFLMLLAQVYFLLIIAAIVLSFFFSRYITKSLSTVSDKIFRTRLDRKNQRINIQTIPFEITGIANAYNSMVDELEESANKLATSEREQAWRDMAKQVAHEVKNPLTPMRLSLQNFERKFDPNDPENKEKVKEFSRSMIEQIDIMSAVASAFSDFAKMPKAQNEVLNIPEVVERALSIFDGKHIEFSATKAEILAHFDRNQLIRIVTNLVKNAKQACDDCDDPTIDVRVSEKNRFVIIEVEDNGEGIADENKNRIFEPKFTTKSSGMGLGLGIAKQIIENYKGKIYFESTQGEGTVFTVEIPKIF